MSCQSPDYARLMREREDPPWTVALICGASGVGKTTAALALANRYSAALGEADDIVTALKALTTAEQLPALHFWDNHPDAASWPAEQIAALHLSVAEELTPAFAAVIADHLEYDARVVFEGDYLLPDLALGFGPRVRAVVLTDAHESIVSNYHAREPDRGPQDIRAGVGVLITAALTHRAHDEVPIVAARPWQDSLARIDAALSA